MSAAPAHKRIVHFVGRGKGPTVAPVRDAAAKLLWGFCGRAKLLRVIGCRRRFGIRAVIMVISR